MNCVALGINIGHDQGAALVKDGRLIAAIAQERLDRIKHSTSVQLPFLAIDAILNHCGVKPDEINIIGFSSTAVQSPDLCDYVRDGFEKYYNCAISKVVPVSHHQAHAESAYFTSGFEEAIAFVADGGGEMLGAEEEAESIFLCRDGQVQLQEQRLQDNSFHSFIRPHNYIYPFMNKSMLMRQISLGKKYEQVTNMIGLGIHGAGKTMGLSSYGTNIIDDAATPVYSPLQFDLSFERFLSDYYMKYKESGENYFTYLERHRADIAKTVQNYTENQVLEIIHYIVEKYAPANLCLSGGLFLNCPINQKIAQEYPDIHLHICPAAGDDGQALGTAFAAYRNISSNLMPSSKVLPYLGLCYSNTYIEQVLRNRHIPFHFYGDEELAKITAKELYNNKIVGLLRGRSEIGPRALCHRSILANPTNPNMKDYINAKVKHRESFRPFAPVVVAEHQFKYFDLCQRSPYMLFAAQVFEPFQSKIPAVTHVDGTARIQALSEEDDTFVHHLLWEFNCLSGVPILLNTSFNDCGEPIVESPDDALRTFLTTEIDILVMENYIVFKHEL